MRGLCVVVLVGCGRIAFDPGSESIDAALADAQSCVAAANCIAFETAGSCHQVCTTSSSYAQADAACRAWGGCLAALETMGEGAEVAAQNMMHVGRDSWIGLVQAPTGMEPGDGWSWDCSAVPGPFPWSGAQPDDMVAPEECAILHLNLGGTVFDAPCDWQASYICER